MRRQRHTRVCDGDDKPKTNKSPNGRKARAKMNKAEMNETIKAYAVANEAKKQAADEVKELGEAIKAYFEERGLEAFEADGYVAKVGTRKGKKLNLDKVAALLGGEIPADCFEDTETPVLTVKASKTAKAGRTTPKAAPAEPAPATAVVATAVAA